MSANYSYSSSSFVSATYSSSGTASSSSDAARGNNGHNQAHSQRYTETVTSNDRDGTTVYRTHEETGKPILAEAYHAPATSTGAGPGQGRGVTRGIADGGGVSSDGTHAQNRIQDVTDDDDDDAAVDPEQEERDRQYLERMEDEYAKREGGA
ncbi:hypothetical protein PV08_00460 [Exophiala spinifera]|uniref:Uncharacterized protein n=1 Tax=Exophiala spinifera TaxID=91928 RepID=A0A0D2BMU8_9EURO|nr:uncharacterized protein PV08_00460 [Exophiala spinifera]KIW19885.1 hypothetical protein PV08_00460 [Exophiala spinifera]